MVQNGGRMSVHTHAAGAGRAAVAPNVDGAYPPNSLVSNAFLLREETGVRRPEERLIWEV